MTRNREKSCNLEKLKRLKPFHISLAELFHLSNLINKWEKNLQNILASFFNAHIFTGTGKDNTLL